MPTLPARKYSVLLLLFSASTPWQSEQSTSRPLIVHLAWQLHEETEPGPRQEDMIAEDQSTSSQRIDAMTMQVTDEEPQPGTTMQATDEEAQRELPDHLHLLEPLRHHPYRKAGRTRQTTMTPTRAMG